MFFGFKKNKNKPPLSMETERPPDTTIRSNTTPRMDTEPESLASSTDARQYWNAGISEQDWVGEMFNKQLKSGAFDHLPGKGKPIEVPSGDVTNSMLKHANILPGWLSMQHEIRDHLQKLIVQMTKDSDNEFEKELIELNTKIMKYNNMVPSSVLQKRKISRDNVKQQFQLWE